VKGKVKARAKKRTEKIASSEKNIFPKEERGHEGPHQLAAKTRCFRRGGIGGEKKGHGQRRRPSLSK